MIPASVAEQLGVREVGETQVRYADNRTATRKLVDDVQVDFGHFVTEGEEEDENENKIRVQYQIMF